MKATNSNLNQSEAANDTGSQQGAAVADGQTVEVLYQRMGDRWFAFSLIGDEVFVGSLTPEELMAAESGQTHGQKVYKVTGNS